ncbi:hypothetical protein RFI_24156, partial [Reticulomyxa filosa]
GDKLLELNGESISERTAEDVQFELMNKDGCEAVFTIERGEIKINFDWSSKKKIVETLKVGVEKTIKDGYGFDFKLSSEEMVFIVNKISVDNSNGVKVGDKLLYINEIDASMIKIDDLQSMLDTPGRSTTLVIERTSKI